MPRSGKEKTGVGQIYTFCESPSAGRKGLIV
jgi:hypothetical protein